MKMDGTDGHEGPCSLDFDESRNYLVCAIDGAHQFNLKRAVNRNVVIQQLHRAGQLRKGGYAEMVAKEMGDG